MTIGSFLGPIEPFDSAVTVASHKIIDSYRLPSKRGTGETAHPWRIIYRLHFALVNIVYFDLPVGTAHTDYFIIRANFDRKDFGMGISKEIDNSSGALWCIGKFYLSGIEVFILLEVFLFM